MGCLPHTSPLKAHGSSRKCGRGLEESEVADATKETSQTEWGRCTHDLTAIVPACTNLCELKSRPQQGGGGGNEVLPLGEELLTFDSCGEREGQFSSVV